VLVLDAIDHVRQDTNYDPSEFFYRLLRGEGKLAREISLSVWLVSNELLEVDLRLDSRVESAMSDDVVFFASYGEAEVADDPRAPLRAGVPCGGSPRRRPYVRRLQGGPPVE
jgi:Cdc6-like AAA superfamily ATPase